MDPNTFPTKGNLILAKNSLALSRQGYELMDKKRNILIREMMNLVDQAKDIQGQIDETFRTAYAALQRANMEMGIAFVDQISHTVPIEDSIRIKTRSVMGTEIPLVEYDKSGNVPTYAYYSTKMSLDEAKAAFERVKELSIKLSMIENSAIRLALTITTRLPHFLHSTNRNSNLRIRNRFHLTKNHILLSFITLCILITAISLLTTFVRSLIRCTLRLNILRINHSRNRSCCYHNTH